MVVQCHLLPLDNDTANSDMSCYTVPHSWSFQMPFQASHQIYLQLISSGATVNSF